MIASVSLPHIVLVSPKSPAQIDAARLIFQEYAVGLGIDLCFQNFEAELMALPGEYVEPQGALLLAMVDSKLAGCCAMRPLALSDYPNACEMKRLYVRQLYRRLGLGRQLAEAILDAAKVAGYDHLLLDTLSEMETARALYQDLKFTEIAPYYHNPIAGAHYLKVDL